MENSKKYYLTPLVMFNAAEENKTTRYHYMPTEKANIENTDKTKYWQVCGATQNLIHWW